MEKVKLNTIEEAIEDFKAGNFVIVVDDEDRENEGDLIIAAEKDNIGKSEFYAEACTWSIVSIVDWDAVTSAAQAAYLDL